MHPLVNSVLLLLQLLLACSAPVALASSRPTTRSNVQLSGFNINGFKSRRLQQLPIPPSTQFDITGAIETMTVDQNCNTSTATARVANSKACGGLVKVNGITITIPDWTIVILPATALYWQEVYELGSLGFADSRKPYLIPGVSFQIRAVGNRVVPNPGTPPDRYIAGLVWITQDGLNSGQGFINCIRFDNATLFVGGINGDCTTGTPVQLNDPTLVDATGVSLGVGGRYSIGVNIDKRFQVDQDNPTIISATGYPMCIPRNNSDPLCPLSNRPPTTGNPLSSFTSPNASLQAPFMVGDYVSFAGTLFLDPKTSKTYVSAYSVVNNVAIFTLPGTDPAYISIDTTIIGTGGLNLIGANEATIRTRFEGTCTDSTRPIIISGYDYASGSPTARLFGTIMPDPGPPAGAVKGRWRFRPPCDPAGSQPAKPDKTCVMNANNTFLPPPREVFVQIGGSTPNLTAANGLTAGQYHAPISDYLFPEPIPGNPMVENNFNSMDFLACGGYASSTYPGTSYALTLSPWPSNSPPTCPASTTEGILDPLSPLGNQASCAPALVSAVYRTSKQRLDVSATFPTGCPSSVAAIRIANFAVALGPPLAVADIVRLAGSNQFQLPPPPSPQIPAISLRGVPQPLFTAAHPVTIYTTDNSSPPQVLGWITIDSTNALLKIRAN